MLKKSIMMLVALLVAFPVFAATITFDGPDGLTEGNLGDWQATNGGTLAYGASSGLTSLVGAVGTQSIWAEGMVEGGALYYDFAPGHYLKVTGSSILRYDISTVTEDNGYNLEVQLWSENGAYAVVSGSNLYGKIGDLAWLDRGHFISGSTFINNPTTGETFDYDKVNRIQINATWVNLYSGITIDVGVDRLRLENVEYVVPEPATFSVIGLGALCGFIRRKRR